MDLSTTILGIAFFLNTSLGIFTFVYTKKDLTNKYYLGLVLSVSIWIATNFVVPFINSDKIAFVVGALGYVGALCIAYFFLNFCIHFPKPSSNQSRVLNSKVLLLILVVLSVATFIPGVIIQAIDLNPWSITPRATIGVIFFYFLVLLGNSFLILFKKIRDSEAKTDEKIQIKFVFVGYLLAAFLGTIFNLLLPYVYHNYSFVRTGPSFVLLALFLMAYAILKHHLFNIKLIATETLVFGIWIAVISQAVMAETLNGKILGGVTLVFTILAGIFLIKSVKKEVAQREEIEQLAWRLKSVNRIMSHDIKNVLGKNKDMFGMLLDGSLGALSEQAKPFLEQVSYDTKKLIRSVIVILESGQDLVLKPEPFDLKEAVLEVVHDEEMGAKGKGLTLTTNIDEKETYTIVGDRTHIVAHVLRNLIENAIHYTLEGSITIGLSKKDANTVLFSVRDTGIGIPDEDKQNIFKEGGHGKDSIKVNVHSTGYGLFSAKRIVDAHGGKVWFDTEHGKGTTFYVELPKG